ncbi:hypothetical protein JW992_03495 [candidate division KSB1 bacterium]|nr:hypothetical protein [candidate division KSB1 bacterium]
MKEKTKSCQSELLLRMAFGELGFWQRRRLGRHLKTCDSCARSLATTSRIARELHGKTRVPCPETLVNDVWHKTIAEPQQNSKRAESARFGRPLALALVAALLLVVVAGIYRHTGQSPSSERFSAQEIRQAQEDTHNALQILSRVMRQNRQAVERSMLPPILSPLEKSMKNTIQSLFYGG